jgi:phage FluMu protein Com
MTREEGWILCSVTPAPVSGIEEAGEHRCICGKLLFRHTPEGIELKCSRCKTVMFLRIEARNAESECSGDPKP